MELKNYVRVELFNADEKSQGYFVDEKENIPNGIDGILDGLQESEGDYVKISITKMAEDDFHALPGFNGF